MFEFAVCKSSLSTIFRTGLYLGFACLLTLGALWWLSGGQWSRPDARALASPASEEPRAFRLHFDDLSELRRAQIMIESFDLLGVDIPEGYAVLLLSEEDAGRLRLEGFHLEEDERYSGERLSAWSSQYYTYSRMAADLSDFAARFPSLATLNDLGPSWETTQGRANRRIWALRIGRNPAGKPQALFVANEHAREIVTVEIAMRLAGYLLEGYGSDPEATFLVDNRDTWIVPMVNPDGHLLVEQGAEWKWKRKNANTGNGACSGVYWGVDLNRNFLYKWGFPGASADPCNETYRGPASSSEPETQAIVNLINANSFSVLMDYHSYSNLILWPWGYTNEPISDARLPAIGRKLAQLTGRSGSTPYTPMQGSDLYLTSGTLLDWAYAARNVLAFTTEIGSAWDDFDPDYSRVNAFWSENRPPALYLLNIADDPSRAYGPEGRSAAVTPASTGFSGTVTLTAAVSDAGNGDQDVVAAEYFVNSAGADGTGSSMDPLDGSFNSSTEAVQAIIPASELGPGRHLLLVRGRDSAGNWGSLGHTFVRVESPYKLYMPLVRNGFVSGW